MRNVEPVIVDEKCIPISKTIGNLYFIDYNIFNIVMDIFRQSGYIYTIDYIEIHNISALIQKLWMT